MSLLPSCVPYCCYYHAFMAQSLKRGGGQQGKFVHSMMAFAETVKQKLIGEMIRNVSLKVQPRRKLRPRLRHVVFAGHCLSFSGSTLISALIDKHTSQGGASSTTIMS